MGDEGKIVAGVFGKIERSGRYDREIKLSNEELKHAIGEAIRVIENGQRGI